MVEKAQQYYVFIETVEKIGISQIILKRFHYAMIENVLTFSITVWFGRASYEEKAQLETLVKCTSKIIRLTLPTIESVYHTRCMLCANRWTHRFARCNSQEMQLIQPTISLNGFRQANTTEAWKLTWQGFATVYLEVIRMNGEVGSSS